MAGGARRRDHLHGARQGTARAQGRRVGLHPARHRASQREQERQAGAHDRAYDRRQGQARGHARAPTAIKQTMITIKQEETMRTLMLSAIAILAAVAATPIAAQDKIGPGPESL